MPNRHIARLVSPQCAALALEGLGGDQALARASTGAIIGRTYSAQHRFKRGSRRGQVSVEDG